jgi:cell pole-organizing protein PopZ
MHRNPRRERLKMSFSSNDIYNTGGPGSSAEPSMEEILASIRRILKEDDTVKTAPVDLDDDVLVLDQSMIAKPADLAAVTYMPLEVPPPEPPAAPLQTSPEPLHFSSEPVPFAEEFIPAAAEPYVPAAVELPPARAAEPAPEPAHEPEPPPVLPAYEPLPEPTPPEPPRLEPIMSDNSQENVQPPHSLISDKTTDAAASSIGALVRSMSTEKAVAISRNGVTIEDIVRDEIRPLLKSWLDTHLPSLVERVVRTEIERVIDRST